MKTACDLLFETLKSFDNNLGDLRLKNAVFFEDDNLLKIEAISDVAVNNDGVNFIVKSIKDRIGSDIKVELEVKKSICDKDLAYRVINEYLKEKCFHISHLITSESVKVLSVNKRIVFELNLTEGVSEFFSRTSELDKMCSYLSRAYAHDFIGSIKIVSDNSESVTYEVDTVDFNELEDSTLRHLKVTNVLKYCDDTVYDTAMYIEDGKDRIGPNFFAGVVIEIESKVSKNGKPYNLITLDDKSGQITGRFFTNDKQKLKKLEKISVGSQIIMRCENELFNGSPSLTIKGYHLCEFPINYIPKEKPSKKASEKYSLVFPESIVSTKQEDFFSVNKELPIEIKNGTYSVVDIETTGTDTQFDKITEIAAVKIVNGVITESFQTLVNPEVSIPERIVELTGIDDELVKDSPTIDMVYPDFFKFVENTVFVAHNAEFDFRFLKNAGKNFGYLLKNQVLDTLYLSRKILPSLKNHKLNTVCDYFNITFNHHRALSDALATAEMLLELLKGKKSLKDI
ncbi:MAG: 3'-5' exoribonuclease [Clostridia bacterium]|nr:3'-5' exoribonuclease [Clostridia bacterium]